MSGLKKISSGKVRDIYDAGNDKLLIVVSDRISAYDVIMNDEIPEKGIILNKLSEFWFSLTKSIVPNHLITADTDEFPGRGSLVRKLKMLPVECIVRGYLSGSGWESYKNTQKVCGITLPAGLLESAELPEPIFTPSTKAELGDHDENISFERAAEIIGYELAEKVRAASIAVYNLCAEYARSRGIIIADTKFEFGLDDEGTLTLGDEVLTPDSSRFWDAGTYEPGKSQPSYDKQYLRDWLTANGYKGSAPERLPRDVINTTRAKYVEAYEIITGEAFHA